MVLKAKKIFTIYMVLTILVSSNTFAYYEHVCLLTKVKSLSLRPNSCAGTNSEKNAEDFSPHFQKKSVLRFKSGSKKNRSKQLS